MIIQVKNAFAQTPSKSEWIQQRKIAITDAATIKRNAIFCAFGKSAFAITGITLVATALKNHWLPPFMSNHEMAIFNITFTIASWFLFSNTASAYFETERCKNHKQDTLAEITLADTLDLMQENGFIKFKEEEINGTSRPKNTEGYIAPTENNTTNIYEDFIRDETLQKTRNNQKIEFIEKILHQAQGETKLDKAITSPNNHFYNTAMLMIDGNNKNRCNELAFRNYLADKEQAGELFFVKGEGPYHSKLPTPKKLSRPIIFSYGPK